MLFFIAGIMQYMALTTLSAWVAQHQQDVLGFTHQMQLSFSAWFKETVSVTSKCVSDIKV
jgi:hypothetical protein